MTTLRIKHSKNYTCIANQAIRDNRLSFKARGLHHLLLSYPDNWTINTAQLTAESDRDGREAIASALKELETFGYFERKKLRGQDGRITWETFVYELPFDGKTINGKPVNGSTTDGKSINGKSVDGKPPHIISTDLLSTDLLSTDSESTYFLGEQAEKGESEKVGNSIDSEPIAQSSELETEPQAIEPYQSSVPVNSNPETKQTNLDGAKYSAAAQISSKDEKYSSAHRQEKLFEPIAPWRDSRRQLLPEFVEWLGKQFPDDGRMGQAAKARSFILNCEQGRQSIEKLEGFWDDYQAEQRKREEADRLRRESIATPVESESVEEPGVLTMTPEVQRIFAETNEKLKNRKRWNLKYAG